MLSSDGKWRVLRFQIYGWMQHGEALRIIKSVTDCVYDRVGGSSRLQALDLVFCNTNAAGGTATGCHKWWHKIRYRWRHLRGGAGSRGSLASLAFHRLS